MNRSSPDSWYAFHFGSKFTSSPEFDPHSLFVGTTQVCYVMNADLCSFTTFCKVTDDMRAVEPLITSFYSRVRKAIHGHSGMLDKIIGDAVVAVWGLHIRQETLIQQVLAAARELTKIANTLAEQWQCQIDQLIEPKGLRIGVSKGPIIVIRRDEAYPGLSLLGNAINLASRLQAAASPNQLVCSNLVYRDIEQSKLKLNFQPYKSTTSNGFVDAKNYGPIKAWALDLK
jgi:class 3 adenylate cyclase